MTVYSKVVTDQLRVRSMPPVNEKGERSKASKTWDQIHASDVEPVEKKISGSAKERKEKDKPKDDQGEDQQ